MGRPVAVAAAALVALGGGGVAGYLAEQQVDDGPAAPTEARIVGADGTVGVVVPAEWTAVGTDGWLAPNAADGVRSAAVSAGTEDGWAADDDAEGVFVGLLDGELPDSLPVHDECRFHGPDTRDELPGGDVAVTAVSTECPSGVTIERLVEVNDQQLLWVQVRSAEPVTAFDVLDSVETYGP